MIGLKRVKTILTGVNHNVLKQIWLKSVNKYDKWVENNHSNTNSKIILKRGLRPLKNHVECTSIGGDED